MYCYRQRLHDQPARRSCQARACCWSGNCSDIGDTARGRAMLALADGRLVEEGEKVGAIIAKAMSRHLTIDK